MMNGDCIFMNFNDNGFILLFLKCWGLTDIRAMSIPLNQMHKRTRTTLAWSKKKQQVYVFKRTSILDKVWLSQQPERETLV